MVGEQTADRGSSLPRTPGEDMSFIRRNKDEITDFDYIIVGAGSAGCVIARRLIDGTEASVLLLEAGGTDEGIASIANPSQWVENIGAAHDWNYTYSPSPHTDDRSIFLSRGKVLGGSGSTNALIWLRGNRTDFDDWAQAGNPGWDYDSVLPLFKRSEDWEDGASDYRGSSGPLHIERAKNLHPVATALIDHFRSTGSGREPAGPPDSGRLMFRREASLTRAQ